MSSVKEIEGRSKTQVDEQRIEQFANTHRLPKAFLSIAAQYYQPLARQIAKHTIEDGLRLLGICGAQGTGKSTLAAFVAQFLTQEFGLTVVCLSLDDFYLRKSERLNLASSTHPLLATRGVPGTHDIQLANTVINSLLAGNHVQIPRFDKSIDDRAEVEQFDISDGQVDLVVLEGWCVGAKVQQDEVLLDPINELERIEDPDGKWRTYVNQALGSDYTKLYSKLDYLVFLQAPSLECVYEWRGEQEKKLRDKVGDRFGEITPVDLQRFIMHYERITRDCLAILPIIADAVMSLNPGHGVESLTYKRSSKSDQK